MKLTVVMIMTAGYLLIGATAAFAQSTNQGAIQTNPGAIGEGGMPNQSLQPTTGGQGLGYSAQGAGVSPGPSTSNPGGANPPTGTSSAGSASSGVSGSSKP